MPAVDRIATAPADPRALMLLLAAAVPSAVLLPADARLATLLILLLCAAAGTGTLRALLRRLRIVLPMTILIAVVAALRSPAGQSLLVPDLQVTREGLIAGGWFGLRILAAAVAGLLFTLLVPLTEGIAALQRLRVPATVIAVAWLTDRTLHQLTADARRMTESVRARSAALSLPRRIAVTARISGTFLVRSVGRSERMADAMTARGFDGRIPVLRSLRWRRRDALVTLTGFVSLIILWLA